MVNPRKINDESLEYAIALARWGGLAWLLIGWLLAGVSVLVDSWRLGQLGFLVTVVGIAACWFGWFRYGNEEWRADRPAPAKELCTAEITIHRGGQFQLLQCAKPLNHLDLEHYTDQPGLSRDERTWT